MSERYRKRKHCDAAMIGENGFPVTPEWAGCVGNLCAACLATGNLCHVLTKVDDEPCCRGCTHRVEPTIQTWQDQGDQA